MNMNSFKASVQKQALFYSLIIVLAAQVNINLFVNNFKISIAVILLSVFVFMVKPFPLIYVTFLGGTGVYLSRVLVYWFQNGSIENACSIYFPEFVFYLVYGLLLFFYTVKQHPVSANVKYMAPIFLIDYFSNLMELLFRLRFQAFETRTQISILLFALLRTAMIWMIVAVFDHYKFLLLKREHAERYQRLMLLISKLNGEVIWLKKNTALIEETMKASYLLYDSLKQSGSDEALSKTALNVAKDIHEIKKEYLLILRGISEAMEMNLNDEGMYLVDILKLLEASCTGSIQSEGRTLTLDIRCDKDLYTDKHYFLLSVFRNLLTNAMEANTEPHIHLSVSQSRQDNDYLFLVTDNGSGIAPEFIGQIFEPGFSTKINYATGEVSRGLGLNLVKDMIENQFSGNIWVESRPGKTTFYIQIPNTELEVL